jgi:hypothetical protein
MTRSIINLRSATRMFLAAGLALCASVPTPADVIVGWVNEEFYGFEVTHVPDLDQRRSALPNGGNAYCVPTSAVNWAAYFANHGLPSLPPGPGYWAYPELYDQATDAIYLMGVYMLTDPYDGTGVKAKHLGLRVWFGLTGHFAITTFYTDDDWSPSVGLMNRAVLTGAYVIPSVGWYFEIPGTSYILRDGGHAVSLVSGARYKAYFQMGIHCPGSDEGDNTVQSPFTTEVYDAEQAYRRIAGLGDLRIVYRFPDYGGGGKIGYLDGFSAIWPSFVLTTHPNEPGLIVRRWAMEIYGMSVPVVEEWETAELVAVRLLIVHPDFASCLYVADAEPAGVYRLDPVTGESKMIQFPFDDPREIMVSRLRDLYVLDGDDLVRVAIDVKPAREEGRITPPGAMSAMAYDDETDEVVLLAPGDQAVTRYQYHYDGDPVTKLIVPEIPLSDNASMCWDAMREAIWVISDASNSLFMLTDLGPYSLQSQEFTDPALVQPPDAIGLNDGGHIFVSCDGLLLEFELLEKGLELVENPLFPDAEAGEHLCIARSSTNYDESIHEGEEWRNVLPDTYTEPMEECVADLDVNGTVNTADLLALLAAWGPCPPDEFCHADFDYSGAVGTTDLLTLLAAWGPCEPLGACCIWDGTCLDLSANDCALQGESIWFEGESCDTFQCPDWPTGACCVEGECVATNTEYECSELDGNWFEGEDCTNFECPTEYCESWGNCGQHISRVQMGDIDNPTGCDTGYSDYTGLSAEVTIGYVRQIMITTANPQPEDVCGIWVDWDQDFVFDYPRDYVDGGDLSAGFWITQIGAPLDAKPGPTRLRLCLVNDDFPFACGPLGPGETEDYTIIVVE